MGSPVSVVVAEIVMQHVGERALSTCRQTIPLWLRYVDDTFTAIHKDEIDAFVPTAFLVLLNFHSCLYNSIETRYMFSIS